MPGEACAALEVTDVVAGLMLVETWLDTIGRGWGSERVVPDPCRCSRRMVLDPGRPTVLLLMLAPVTPLVLDVPMLVGVCCRSVELRPTVTTDDLRVGLLMLKLGGVLELVVGVADPARRCGSDENN